MKINVEKLFLTLLPIILQGSDDPPPPYNFELTTNFFSVDPEGYLIVNKDNLDRDPPSPGKFRFQVSFRIIFFLS